MKLQETLERIDAAARQGGYTQVGTSPAAMMLFQVGSSAIHHAKHPERLEKIAGYVQELRGWCQAGEYEGDPVADLFAVLEVIV